MPTKLNEMFAPDGLRYGWEWQPDGFDHHIDGILQQRYTQRSDRHSPIVALDIGCGDGTRAARLAELGIFDTIIACDKGDRTAAIAAHNIKQQQAALSTNHPVCAIEFFQVNIVDLAPNYFDNIQIAFINCRNVMHFLSQPHARRSIDIMNALLMDSGMMAISFDSYTERPPTSIFNDDPQGSFYKQPVAADKGAPYRAYYAPDVEEYMTAKGLRISQEFKRANANICPIEHHILAFATSRHNKPLSGLLYH